MIIDQIVSNIVSIIQYCQIAPKIFTCMFTFPLTYIIFSFVVGHAYANWQIHCFAS